MRIWNPACRVRLYLPKYSTTKALCCGTTVAVLMTMITTTTATTITPNVKCKEPSMIYPLLRLAVQYERQTLDAGDARAAAGRDLCGPAVDRAPGTAAILQTAGIPR